MAIHWRPNKNVKNNKLLQEIDTDQLKTGLSETQFYALFEHLHKKFGEGKLSHKNRLFIKIERILFDEPPAKVDDECYFFKATTATAGENIWSHLCAYQKKMDDILD